MEVQTVPSYVKDFSPTEYVGGHFHLQMDEQKKGVCAGNSPLRNVISEPQSLPGEVSFLNTLPSPGSRCCCRPTSHLRSASQILEDPMFYHFCFIFAP